MDREQGQHKVWDGADIVYYCAEYPSGGSGANPAPALAGLDQGGAPAPKEPSPSARFLGRMSPAVITLTLFNPKFPRRAVYEKHVPGSPEHVVAAARHVLRTAKSKASSADQAVATLVATAATQGRLLAAVVVMPDDHENEPAIVRSCVEIQNARNTRPTFSIRPKSEVFPAPGPRSLRDGPRRWLRFAYAMRRGDQGALITLSRSVLQEHNEGDGESPAAGTKTLVSISRAP